MGIISHNCDYSCPFLTGPRDRASRALPFSRLVFYSGDPVLRLQMILESAALELWNAWALIKCSLLGFSSCICDKNAVRLAYATQRWTLSITRTDSSRQLFRPMWF